MAGLASNSVKKFLGIHIDGFKFFVQKSFNSILSGAHNPEHTIHILGLFLQRCLHRPVYFLTSYWIFFPTKIEASSICMYYSTIMAKRKSKRLENIRNTIFLSSVFC